ncbi:hypothetical protein PMIN06_004810 [Paraphaeosphaeria minitans]|uniref:Uncharacterized protein n=1 Tax=Paraphaeosphaeria minitans TaxID=565426 RepID=A0A9P6KX44_9PLEO|nr:hypothetical protein PMIN01_01163 [Paraphaeosphaeria minitans]
MNVYPVYHACFDLSGAGAAALLHAGWTRSTFTPSPVSLTRREEESATIISRANPPGGVDELQPSPPPSQRSTRPPCSLPRTLTRGCSSASADRSSEESERQKVLEDSLMIPQCPFLSVRARSQPNFALTAAH